MTGIESYKDSLTLGWQKEFYSWCIENQPRSVRKYGNNEGWVVVFDEGPYERALHIMHLNVNGRRPNIRGYSVTYDPKAIFTTPEKLADTDRKSSSVILFSEEELVQNLDNLRRM
jgi:hypothetical protein